jgi:hypothetical protein
MLNSFLLEVCIVGKEMQLGSSREQVWIETYHARTRTLQRSVNLKMMMMMIVM